jgi:hypothetical protein
MVLFTSAEAGILSLFDPIQANSNSKDSIFTNFQSFIADDPVSIHDLFNRWHGSYHPKSGNNLIIDDIRIDIGGSSTQWGYLGYTYRHQSFTQASNDLILLIWQQLNHINFTIGKKYKLNASIKGYEIDGIVYAKQFPLFKKSNQNLIIGIATTLLHGYQIQDGYLNGTATAISNKTYSFNAIADYRYTENYLYNLNVDKANGLGYTIDLSIQYRYKNLLFNFIGNDIHGRIQWKRLPYSYVELNSQIKTYDSYGFTSYNPTIRGVEKYIDYTQKLYTKWRLEGVYTYNELSKITLGSDYLQEVWLPYIEFSHQFNQDIQASISYENRFKMVGLNLNYKNLSFTCKANDYDHPSALALTLSYAYLF